MLVINGKVAGISKVETDGTTIRGTGVGSDSISISDEYRVKASDVSDIETDVSNLQTSISGIQTSISGIQTSISRVETDVVYIENELAKLSGLSTTVYHDDSLSGTGLSGDVLKVVAPTASTEDLVIEKSETDGTISIGFAGIEGEDYIDAEFKESSDGSQKWVIGQAERDEIYLDATNSGVSGDVLTDESVILLNYTDNTIPANTWIMDDGSVVCRIMYSIVEGREPTAADKLIINVSEKIENNTDTSTSSWLNNAISFQQGTINGTLPDITSEETTDEILAKLKETYNQTGGWYIKWGDVIWKGSNHYSSDVGTSEISFSNIIQSSYNICCYRIVYDGDSLNDDAVISTKMTVIANKEGLTRVDTTGAVTELTEEMNDVIKKVNSKILTNIPFAAITGSYAILSKYSSDFKPYEAELSLFKPDINFTLKKGETIASFYLTQGTISGNIYFVICEIPDITNPTTIRVIGVSDGSNGVSYSSSNTAINITIDELVDDLLEYEITTDGLYYCGFVYNGVDGDAYFLGNTFGYAGGTSWGIENVKPYLTATMDNLSITSMDDVLNNFTRVGGPGHKESDFGIGTSSGVLAVNDIDSGSQIGVTTGSLTVTRVIHPRIFFILSNPST